MCINIRRARRDIGRDVSRVQYLFSQPNIFYIGWDWVQINGLLSTSHLEMLIFWLKADKNRHFSCQNSKNLFFLFQFSVLWSRVIKEDVVVLSSCFTFKKWRQFPTCSFHTNYIFEISGQLKNQSDFFINVRWIINQYIFCLWL